MLMVFLFYLKLLSKETEKLSYITINGVIGLRNGMGAEQSVRYKSLNHEGGIIVRVLDVAKSDLCCEESDIWLHVVLAEPFGAENGEHVEVNKKFWVLLSDEKKVFFN